MSTSILTGFDSDECSRCHRKVVGPSAVLLIGGETYQHEPTEDYPDPVLHTMEWASQDLLCKDCANAIHEQYMDPDNWFLEALRRKMLRSIDGWDPDDEDIPHFRYLVTRADTVGDLINILHTDWGLHNDISQLVDIINEACQERNIK